MERTPNVVVDLMPKKCTKCVTSDLAEDKYCKVQSSMFYGVA